MESALASPPTGGCDHGSAEMPDLPLRSLT